MKTRLVKGQEVLMDDDVYNAIKCEPLNITTTGYPRIGCRYKLHHHPLLLPIKSGYIVDHLDKNKLNCQRANLQYSDHRTNRLNAHDSQARDLPPRIYKNGKGYRGQISFDGIIYRTKTVSSINAAVLELQQFLTTFSSRNETKQTIN